MAVSGFFVVLVALGLVPLVVLGGETDAAWVLFASWLLLVLALGLVDLRLAASPRTVAITRSVPARARLGETVQIELLLANRGKRTLRGRVRDGWQPSAGVAGANRAPVTIPPGERRRIVLTLTPLRRGERRTRLVTIRSWGPLRLWARQASLEAPASLRVLPPFLARKHLPSRLARLRELEGRTPVMVRGQGTEFDSIREYVRGDDVRSIDWRATARRSGPDAAAKLMVRTWRPERDRRVLILVDTARTSAARIDDETRLDTAFEASLLLAALASHAGDRVDFLAWDRRVRGRVHGATGPELLSRMVDAMAGIEPELIEIDWAAVPGQLRSLSSRHALVVLLTSLDSAGSSRRLLSVLPQLTKRHTLIVASVTDPSMLRATRGRGDREEVYTAAAAERALLDAERVSAAVRRLGGHVVTAPPSELPPALADRYIALKASGRL